jgi:serine phosphatase RsbU (regulator of sigma subunit)
VEIAEEFLTPGDRLLLFTDGVTEGRSGRRPFGEARLIELVRQNTAAGLPAPETLRRLCHAVLDHHDGPLADDATLLFVEWSEKAAQRMTP